MFLPGMMWFPSWTFLVKLALKLHPLSLTMSPRLIIDTVCFLCEQMNIWNPPRFRVWPSICLTVLLKNTLKSSKPNQTRVYKYLKGCKTSQEGPEQLESPSQFPHIRVCFVPASRQQINFWTPVFDQYSCRLGGCKDQHLVPVSEFTGHVIRELRVLGRFKLFPDY